MGGEDFLKCIRLMKPNLGITVTSQEDSQMVYDF